MSEVGFVQVAFGRESFGRGMAVMRSGAVSRELAITFAFEPGPATVFAETLRWFGFKLSSKFSTLQLLQIQCAD